MPSQTPMAAAGARRGSIKTTLFGALALLAALLMCALGWKGVDAWTQLSLASQNQAIDAGANRYIAGLYEVLMERLATNNALQAEAPATPAVRQQIENHRRIVQQNFEPGLAILQGQQFPNRDTLVRDLRAALDAANQARSAADQALGQPRDQRDATLRQNFVPVVTRSVDAALGVWFAAMHAAAASDPALARLAMIKEIGWRMRDYSGRERSNVSQAIASGGQLSAQQLAANASFRAQVDLLWSQLENLTADPSTHPAIRQAMAGAREQYFANFVRLADQMRQISEQRGTYPMNAAQWTETTTPQIGALLEVLYAAGRASEAYTTAEISAARWNIALIALALVAGIVVMVGASVVVVRRVSRPLTVMADTMSQLAAGDLNVEIEGRERRDEIGAMAEAVTVFKENMVKARELAAREAEEAEARERRAAKIQQLTEQFDSQATAALGAVTTAVSSLQTSATTMSGVADEASRQSTAVAAASEEASTNVTTVATATEELAGSIAEITRQVAQSTQIAGKAMAESNKTNETVKSLAEAAQKIGDVVKLINDIAGQTNLLALNATIEAARAGEAGKGFAVVASEVKSLATQTAKATEEIAAQINMIQGATRQSVAAIEGIGSTINDLNEIATTIASAVEEQGAATREIAGNVQRAAAGTSEVSSSIVKVTKAAGETGSAAVQVQSAAGDLSQQAETLRRQVDTFLATIRAA